MKRIILILLTFFSLNSGFSQTFTVGDIQYKVTNTAPNTVEADDYTGSNTTVTIPASVVNNSISYSVTSIGNIAFSANSLTSVTIPNSVTSIESFAFSTNSLTSVTIPNSVTNIEQSAFRGNSLTSVTIGTGVTSIEPSVFLDNSLTTVTIPDGVTSIGDYAFASNSLTSVIIGIGVTSIGEEAFKDNSLTSVTIPSAVTSIEREAFRDNSLTSVTIGAGVTSIGNLAFFNGNNSSTSLTSVNSLSTTPATLSVNMFRNIDNIDLTIPPSTITAYTNAEWTGFKTVNAFTLNDIEYSFTGATANTLEAIDYTGSDTEITIPANVVNNSISYSVTSIGDYAFNFNSLTSVIIPDGVISIGDRAFFDNSLTSITIPNSVISIGDNAFSSNSLTSVIIPNSVTSIGNDTFKSNSLTSVTIGTGVISIGHRAFQSNSITSVTIPNNVISIESFAFNNNSLISVTIGTGVTSIGTSVFNGNSLTSVTIPNTVTSIGGFAFNNNSLTSITIGTGVTSIGDNAFDNNALTSVNSLSASPATLPATAFSNEHIIDLTIPAGTGTTYTNAGWTGFKTVIETFTVDNIQYTITNAMTNTVEAKDYTGSVAEVTIPTSVMYNSISYSVTSIGQDAFRDNALTSVTIPNSVISIGQDAFRDNALTSVAIGTGVISIGDHAFYNEDNFATSLTGVRSLSSSPATLPADAFRNKSNIDLVIPPSATTAYTNAAWTGFKAINIFTINDIQYEVTSTTTNTLEAKDYTGSNTTVNIPASVEYNGISYSVTSIGNDAFRQNSLTSVTIPNSVTSIGNTAFFLNSLTSVTIGTGVTSIGSSAFNKNSLTSVIIPDAVTSIGGAAFRENALTSVTIGAGVTNIGNFAFFDNAITSVTIPNSVTSVGQDAFRDNSLTSITIPDAVTSIGANAFRANALTSVDIGTGVTSIGDHAFYNADNSATSLTSVHSLSTSPATLPADAFRNRNNIGLIIPPDATTTYTNSGWTGFKTTNVFTVDNIAYTITGIAPNTAEAKDYTGSNTEVTIPASVVYNSISYSVTSIGDQAFNNNSLTSVTIPNSVTSIGQDAFRDNALTSVTIPNSVISIGNHAFYNEDNSAMSLTSVHSLSTSPATLPADAFRNKNNIDLTILSPLNNIYNNAGWTGFKTVTQTIITVNDIRYTASTTTTNTLNAVGYIGSGGKITIPASIVYNSNSYGVTGISGSAFENNSLISVTIPNSVTSIGQGAFGSNSLTSVTIPNSVTSLGSSAFSANSLTSVTIGTGLTSIEYAVFSNNALTSVIIPNNVTSIGLSAFDGNFLTSVTIPDAVTSIGDQAFRNNALTSVTIGSGVTSIGASAFRDNSLANVTIPNSVTSIDDLAFFNNALTSITIPNSVTSIGANAFRENSLTSVTIGTGVISIGSLAFSNEDNSAMSLTSVNSLSTSPATLPTDAFRNKSNIDLTIPPGTGTGTAYTNAGWIGFKTVLGDAITWDGSAWSNTTGPTASDNALIDGDYSMDDDGVFEVSNLTINTGVTLTVDEENLLEVDGDLTNNGSLIVESGSSLITYDANAITGNDIEIRRNTRYADGKYSFVGSPVQQDASIVGSDLGNFVYKYNEMIAYGADGINRWEDASADELVSGKGYTQADQQEIIFNGVPNTGTITYSGTYSEDSDDANEGWNLVANPYPAAIDVEDFLLENSNTSGSVYIWDDNGSDSQRGTNADYIVANESMASSTAAGGQSRYNFALGSAQGFFVKLNSAADTEIEFTETMRLDGSNSDDNFFRKTNLPIARINLTNAQGLFKQTVIGFAQDATEHELNRTYDAQAFNATLDDGLFTLKAGRSLSLNGMTRDWEVIQLQVNTAIAGNYEIVVELEAYDQSLYLRDNLTGEVTDLRNESYSFSAQSGINTDRFELLSSPSGVLGLENSDLLVYAHQSILHIHQQDGEAREYQLFNMNGQKLLTQSVKGKAEINVSSYSKGIYLVFDGEKTHKIILK